MNEMVKQEAPIADQIDEYIQLRDGKKAADEVYAAWSKQNFGDRMEQLEAGMLDALNKMGVDSVAGKAGTVYKKLTTSVTIADAREFRRHVIGGEDWDLIDWRANKTAVNDRVEAGDPLPPGVNRSTFFTVGIRRKTS